MRRAFEVCQRYCPDVYIFRSLFLSGKNVLALWATKRKIYVGFSSDKLKNVLEATVSSKPVEVSDITVIPEDFFFFSKIRQVKA